MAPSGALCPTPPPLPGTALGLNAVSESQPASKNLCIGMLIWNIQSVCCNHTTRKEKKHITHASIQWGLCSVGSYLNCPRTWLLRPLVVGSCRMSSHQRRWRETTVGTASTTLT